MTKEDWYEKAQKEINTLEKIIYDGLESTCNSPKDSDKCFRCRGISSIEKLKRIIKGIL